MSDYKIMPLKVGEFKSMERSSLLYQQDPGTKMIQPIIMYLILGGPKPILVDTGCGSKEWAEKYHHPINQPEEMKPENALKNAGVHPDEIEIVINTHLHWDHCFNNKLFKNAKIFVQKKEMEYAISPLPCHYVYYESYQIGMFPQWLHSLKQMVAIEGEYELMPGIKLVTLPGHTPGMQGVLVNTKKGKYLIASDCLGSFENWTGNDIYKHIPSGIHYSLPDYYQTFDKIEKICDFILPGHDMKVFDKKIYPAE